jgi:hypothetical protein
VTRAELFASAAPPCHECGANVKRVEARWHREGNAEWRPGPWYLICAQGHRVLVEPLP